MVRFITLHFTLKQEIAPVPEDQKKQWDWLVTSFTFAEGLEFKFIANSDFLHQVGLQGYQTFTGTNGGRSGLMPGYQAVPLFMFKHRNFFFFKLVPSLQVYSLP